MSRSETKKKQEEIFKKRRKTVKEGRIIDKNKDYTVREDGKKVLKKRSIAKDLGKVLPFLPVGRMGNIVSKVPGVKNTLTRIGDKVIKGARSVGNKIQQRNVKGQGSGKINPPKVNPKASRVTTTRNTGGGQGSGKFITQRSNRSTNTQITKPKNTQLKKPSTSLIKRPNQNKSKLSNPFPKLAADIALKGSLISSPSIGKENKIEKPKIIKPKITKPNKSPSPNVKKEKLKKIGSAKDYTGKFVNEKGEVAYDSVGDFFRNITGTAKKRARPENRKRIQAETRGATKGVGFSGKSVGNPFKFNRGGSLKPVPTENKGLGKLPQPVRNKMGYMKKGGLVKMRGGGAATKGMNFNRGY